MPKANAAFWRAKFERNKERDAEALAALAARGWEALTLWECELGDRDALTAALRAFLGSPAPTRDKPLEKAGRSLQGRGDGGSAS